MSLDDIEKLKKNNKELQEIINNSWDGIGIIDNNTKFIYVNNAFMPILGFDKKELLNQNFTSFMEKQYVNSFISLLQFKESDKKQKEEIDIVCIRKDKKRVFLKITISTMLNKNLFVINTKDITDQFSQNEILDDYIISMHMDLHGHITKISSAFLKLSGYSKNEIIGKNFSSFAHKDSNLIIYENINKSLENLQEWNGKLKKVKKDGTAFWVNIKIKPIFNKYGDVTGYTSFMFDITNEINLNDETNLLQEQVKDAKIEIEQKNKELQQKSKMAIISETLQKLSHEWRQPLNLISIKAQKLELDYELNPNPNIDEIINTLEEIKNEANTLSSTIGSFQKFLEPKHKKEIVSIKDILNETIEEFNNKNINFELKNDLDIKFLTYKEETKNILTYIISNSIEAIKNRNIDNGLIKFEYYEVDNFLYLEICDNGGGVDEDILHKVFEPYFSTKEKRHGVGLGLYLCKIIVNTHLNGIITIENYESGTKVKISIPIKN